MKKIRLTESQIISILKKQKSDISIKDLAKENGVSQATIYNWRAKYGNMEVKELKCIKGLVEENMRLKRVIASLSLENDAFKIVLDKKFNGLTINYK